MVSQTFVTLLTMDPHFLLVQTKQPQTTNSGAIRCCVPLVGIEPTTSTVVNGVLYPLSYNGTRAEDICSTQDEIPIV